MFSAAAAVCRHCGGHFWDVEFGPAGLGRIAGQDGSRRASSQVFECYWDESTKAADDKDFSGEGVSVEASQFFARCWARVLAIVNRDYKIEIPDLGVGDVRVPPGLKATLRRCLQRDASRRPNVAQLLDERDPFLYPDGGDDLRIPQELLGQIIQRVADRFRDPNKSPPTDDEIRQYPASFYEKIRQLLESD